MGDTLKREFSLSPVDVGGPMSEHIPGLGGTPAMPPMPPGGQSPGQIPFSDPRINPDLPHRVRPSFLQSFLANLGPALAGGLTPIGPHGETAGIGGALQGIQHAQQVKFARQMQQMEMAKQQAAQQSTQQLQAAQTAETSQRTALIQQQVESSKLQQQMLKNRLEALAGGGGNDLLGALGQLSGDEQAIVDSAKQESLMKGDMTPMFQAAEKIAGMRATKANTSLASPFKAWRDQFIKQKGREPNAQEVQNFTTAGAAMRIQGLENLRQDNYLDTTTGTVEGKTAGEFAASNQAEPGRYVKFSGQVSNALKGQSLINDIRDGITQMRNAVNDPAFKLSAEGRALMAVASKSPETALSAVTSGMASKNLSDAEQNYIIAHATLAERAMSLRQLQGQGAGSDQQRAAILRMLPNLATADKAMAEKQLRTLENNVNNVAVSIPKLGKRSQASVGESQKPKDTVNDLINSYGR